MILVLVYMHRGPTHIIELWPKRKDLNFRKRIIPFNGLANRRFKPLSHASVKTRHIEIKSRKFFAETYFLLKILAVCVFTLAGEPRFEQG
mgnify:CR=1 FL=1